jgi:hypothetical protein
MLAPQRPPTIYPVFPYGNHAYGTTSFRPTLLDFNWFDTWPTVRSILLACLMLFSSAAIIGLDIANLAIEGNKQNGISALGVGPAKVGAGIWSGSISFLAAIFIIVIGMYLNLYINHILIFLLFSICEKQTYCSYICFNGNYFSLLFYYCSRGSCGKYNKSQSISSLSTDSRNKTMETFNRYPFNSFI